MEAGSRSCVKAEREDGPLALTTQGPGEHILSNSIYGGILSSHSISLALVPSQGCFRIKSGHTK